MQARMAWLVIIIIAVAAFVVVFIVVLVVVVLLLVFRTDREHPDITYSQDARVTSNSHSTTGW